MDPCLQRITKGEAQVLINLSIDGVVAASNNNYKLARDIRKISRSLHFDKKIVWLLMQAFFCLFRYIFIINLTVSTNEILF